MKILIDLPPWVIKAYIDSVSQKDLEILYNRTRSIVSKAIKKGEITHDH